MTDRLPQAKAWLLVGLIFTGSLVLALVVPGIALWGIGQLGRGKQESVYLAVLLCPLAVLAWAGVLGRLNVAYKRVTGRRDDDVLSTCLAFAVIAALITFVLLVVLAGGHDPQGLAPWAY